MSHITKGLLTGINVRVDKKIDFAKAICQGIKKIETRNSNSLKPYIGKRVRIIRTGVKGQKAMVVGECTIGEPIVYEDEKAFLKDAYRHLVSKDSEFWIKKDGIKYGYPIIEPVYYEKPYEAVGQGIVARRNQLAPSE